jgi:hypothetical protein
MPEAQTLHLFVFIRCLVEMYMYNGCVFAFFTLWKRVITYILSDQSVHITHTYCCVSKLSKFGAEISKVKLNKLPEAQTLHLFVFIRCLVEMYMYNGCAVLPIVITNF